MLIMTARMGSNVILLNVSFSNSYDCEKDKVLILVANISYLVSHSTEKITLDRRQPCGSKNIDKAIERIGSFCL